MSNEPDETLPRSTQTGIDTICDEFEAAVKARKSADVADDLKRAQQSARFRRSL